MIGNLVSGNAGFAGIAICGEQGACVRRRPRWERRQVMQLAT